MPQPPILKDRKLINAPPDLIVMGRNSDFKYPVHRIILMCISPYFQKLFQYSRHPKKETIWDENGRQLSLECIHFDQVEPTTLSTILDYAYSGHVDLDLKDIQDLIIVADMFNIYGLIKEATNFLISSLSSLNCIGIHLFASAYNCFELEKASKDFILKNFESVYNESEEFLTMTSKESLQDIYGTHFLYVPDEIIVWNSLIKWIEFDKSNRLNHFEELAQSLRFGLIDEHSLTYHILSHPFVTNSQGIQGSIQEVLSTRKVLESWEKPQGEINLSEIAKKHLAPRYPKDMIFVFGGRSLDVEFVSPESIVEAYDHRAERWRQVSLEDPAGPRDHHQICVVGQQLFILGGHHGPFNVFNSCRKLNLLTREWSEIAPMREKRAFHASAILGNHIYVIGGYNGAWRLDSVERYDISLNQWGTVASLIEKRSGAGAAVLGGKIYVVGGFRDMNYLNSAERYDPVTNQWTGIASMLMPRSSPAVVSFNDKLHVIGGLTSNGLLASGEKFDPGSGKWENMENEMLEKKCSSAAVVLDDKILVIGGWNGVGGLRTVELWCEKSKRWLLGTKLIRRRTGCAAVVVCDVPNIEDFAWPTRENIVQERVMNALGISPLSELMVNNTSQENEPGQEENPDGIDRGATFPRAAPNGIEDIMDIDAN